MVREAEIQSAAVDVKLGPEVVNSHGRALNVPARSPRTPRCGPRRRLRFAGLSTLPEGKVARRALTALIERCIRRGFLARLIRQRAVGGKTLGVEVHIPRVVPHNVSVTPFEKFGDERDHLRDVARGSWLVRGRADTDAVVDVGELALRAHSKGAPVFAAGSRIHQHLVVDVGHVAHKRDDEAVSFQPAHQYVIGKGASEVPNVGARLHGRTAHVESHVSRNERHEVNDLVRTRVKKSQAHAVSLPACHARASLASPPHAGSGIG